MEHISQPLIELMEKLEKQQEEENQDSLQKAREFAEKYRLNDDAKK